ncbi:unnamed protein product, partial [Ectocarpus fasciculatus]
WTTTLQGRVALMTLLDQFTRNAYRGTSKMFAYDAIACSLARGLVADEGYRTLSPTRMLFVCVCLTHSEKLEDVNKAAVELLSIINSVDSQGSEAAMKAPRVQGSGSLFIIAVLITVSPRFGRYPHRNYILGRESTAEEMEYLRSTKHPSWVRSVGTFLPPGEKTLRAKAPTAAVSADAHPPSRVQRKKYRLLLLHGNKQNAQKFKKATKKAFLPLENILDLHFMSAPQPYVPSGRVADALDGVDTSAVYQRDRNLVWWNATDEVETMEYQGLKESIKAIDDLCRENGPFDGILGFAQSASLAAIIAKMQHSSAVEVQHCAFKFLLLISGFPSRDIRQQYNLSCETAISSLDTPSFHTWGEQDALISPSRSQSLAACFKNAITRPHSGAHFTGAVNRWPVKEMAQWVREVLSFGDEDVVDGSAVVSSVLVDSFEELNSIDDKFQLTLTKNRLRHVEGNLSPMWPFGLSNKDIISSPFLVDLFRSKQPLFETNGVTQEGGRSFVDSFLAGLSFSDALVDDMVVIALCLYPYEVYAPQCERKKHAVVRRAYQGQVFYWIYERILYHVSRLYELLEVLVDKTKDWESLLRLDLLVHTGCSCRQLTQLDDVVVPSFSPNEIVFQASLHSKIVSIFTKRLLLDRKLLQHQEKNDSTNVPYDEAVSKYLNMKPSKCALHCPRLKSALQKRTRLGSDIAEELFLAQHGKYGDADSIRCRKEYVSLLQDLAKHLEDITKFGSLDKLSLLKAKERQADLFEMYASFTEDEYQRRVIDLPLSRAVLFPQPEPVKLSTAEELSPLHTYLQQTSLKPPEDREAMHNANTNDLVFTKGVVCPDGRLDLCKQAIGPAGVESLFESLRADQDPQTGKGAVKHLLLGNNVCGDGLGDEVANHIHTEGSRQARLGVTTWYIAGNRLTVKGITPICEALAVDRRVEQLWLKRNPLLPDGASKIANMLRFNSHLIVLDLVNTGIRDSGAIAIFEALGAPASPDRTHGIHLSGRINASLKHLYLDGNGLSIEAAKVICQYLSTGVNKLTTLSLGCNRLGDEGAKYVCAGMCQDTCVKRLILSSAGIGKMGATYIADMLRINSVLLHLDLSMLKTTKALGELPNRIGVEGACSLARALEGNITLRSLLLFYNNIFQSGIEAFRILLNKDAAGERVVAGKNNTTLVRLELEQMGIPYNELSREEIRFCLRRNYLAVSEADKKVVDECINPSHLAEVASVYR